jgi:hypothetical protein
MPLRIFKNIKKLNLVYSEKKIAFLFSTPFLYKLLLTSGGMKGR